MKNHRLKPVPRISAVPVYTGFRLRGEFGMSRSFVLLLALVPQLILAHHGGSEYDLQKNVEFKAKLTRIDLINPHSWIYSDVTEKDGTVSHHRCEMRSV